MASKGTPAAGLTEIARRVFSGPAYSLVAYTNAQDSLGVNTVASDLVQPTQTNGYAPISIDPNGWSFSGGIATYTHPNLPSNDGFGNPCWVATGAWSGVVQGVALIYGAVVQHYFDLVDGNGAATSFTASAGAKLSIDMQSLVGG